MRTLPGPGLPLLLLLLLEAAPTAPPPAPLPSPIALEKREPPGGLAPAASRITIRRDALVGWVPAKGESAPPPGRSSAGSPASSPAPAIRVEGSSHSGPSKGGALSVTGTVRNDGPTEACNVRIALAAYDERTGAALGGSETGLATKRLGVGKTTSFTGSVRIPAGTGPSEAFFRGKSYTAPEWKHRLGRVEATVAAVVACR